MTVATDMNLELHLPRHQAWPYSKTSTISRSCSRAESRHSSVKCEVFPSYSTQVIPSRSQQRFSAFLLPKEYCGKDRSITAVICKADYFKSCEERIVKIRTEHSGYQYAVARTSSPPCYVCKQDVVIHFEQFRAICHSFEHDNEYVQIIITLIHNLSSLMTASQSFSKLKAFPTLIFADS